MRQTALFQANPEADTAAEDSDCWCTGPDVMKRVHSFWPGGISLDPCSNAWAITNHWVRARTEWTKEDDCLTRRWDPWPRGPTAATWFQPPYSRGLVDRMVDKLCKEWDAGHLHEVLALMRLDTSSEWWEKLRARGAALVLFKIRLAHYEGDKRAEGNNSCSAMWLLTQPGAEKVRRRALAAAFDGFGSVYS